MYDHTHSRKSIDDVGEQRSFAIGDDGGRAGDRVRRLKKYYESANKKETEDDEYDLDDLLEKANGGDGKAMRKLARYYDDNDDKQNTLKWGKKYLNYLKNNGGRIGDIKKLEVGLIEMEYEDE